MDERASGLIADFLEGGRLGRRRGARALAGDASNRRYERPGTRGSETVGSDGCRARPGRGCPPLPRTLPEPTWPPRGSARRCILSEDTEAGLLLLEDLGDALYARLIEVGDRPRRSRFTPPPSIFWPSLHRHTLPADIPVLRPGRDAAGTAGLAYDWYLAGIRGRVSLPKRSPSPTRSARFWRNFAEDTDVLVLRDYHAENLIWLPGPEGHGTCRSARFPGRERPGHPAYDLVSLAEGCAPRRRRRPGTRHAGAFPGDHRPGRGGEFRAAYALLGRAAEPADPRRLRTVVAALRKTAVCRSDPACLGPHDNQSVCIPPCGPPGRTRGGRPAAARPPKPAGRF
jgi:hypothetical protein